MTSDPFERAIERWIDHFIKDNDREPTDQEVEDASAEAYQSYIEDLTDEAYESLKYPDD